MTKESVRMTIELLEQMAGSNRWTHSRRRLAMVDDMRSHGPQRTPCCGVDEYTSPEARKREEEQMTPEQSAARLRELADAICRIWEQSMDQLRTALQEAGLPAPLWMDGWQKVVFADQCPDCPDCGEPFCEKHKKHYYMCSCVGPTQYDYEYQEVDGVMYARKLETEGAVT